MIYRMIAAYLEVLLSSESDSDDVEEIIATIFPRKLPKSSYFKKGSHNGRKTGCIFEDGNFLYTYKMVFSFIQVWKNKCLNVSGTLNHF